MQNTYLKPCRIPTSRGCTTRTRSSPLPHGEDHVNTYVLPRVVPRQHVSPYHDVNTYHRITSTHTTYHVNTYFSWMHHLDAPPTPHLPHHLLSLRKAPMDAVIGASRLVALGALCHPEALLWAAPSDGTSSGSSTDHDSAPRSHSRQSRYTVPFGHFSNVAAAGFRAQF